MQTDHYWIRVLLASLVGGITSGVLLSLYLSIGRGYALLPAVLQGLGFGVFIWIVLAVAVARYSHR